MIITSINTSTIISTKPNLINKHHPLDYSIKFESNSDYINWDKYKSKEINTSINGELRH
jgi:hypothetical protein